MKKITFLLLMLMTSVGFSQTLLQGFESAGSINGGPFGNMPVPVIEPGTGSNTSQVLKIVTNPAQQPWQGINLFLSPSTDLTVNKTLTMDVLSNTPITFLVKVTKAGSGSAAPVTHNGDGTWQTLSFTFNTALDGQAANPTGIYNGFVIHPYWEVGRTDFFNPTVVPKPPRTFYVDNIREPALENDATLSDLKVDGITINGFDPNTTDYTVVASSASSIPQITSAPPTNSLASTVITQATELFEDATVVVTAEDGITTETYTIRIGLLTDNVIQDFEDVPNTITAAGITADNGKTQSLELDPDVLENNGTSLRMTSSLTGSNIQACFFNQVSDFVELTPEYNTVKVDVYASQAFHLRLKLEVGGANIERTQSYDGSSLNTWQTLTYDFGAVNATYERIVFFLNSNATNNGFLESQNFTAYVDNVSLTSLQTERLYIYESDEWEPENPVGVSSSTSNILVKDGTANIAGVLEGNNLEVRPGAKLEITYPGVLQLAGDIINNGDIVFKSDTNGSGQLAEFNRTISGSGEITSERYIPAGEGLPNGNRAFRYLSTSVTTSGSIFENWQEAGSSNAGFGTHITGIEGVVGGFDDETGLDYTETGNSSMFGFNNDSGQWEAVENTKIDNTSGSPEMVVLQNFDGNTGLYGNFEGAAFGYQTSVQPGFGEVARLTHAPGGAPFQGVNVSLFEPLDLTTDKTMQIQVYSLNTISILLKVNGGIDGAPDSAAALTINGQDSWQTLTVAFDQSLDGTLLADGVYTNLVIHYFWNTVTNNFPTITPGLPEQVFFVNDISGYPVASTSSVANLKAGVPYAIMIRGDRTTDLTTNTPQTSNTVLRAKGSLKTGLVTETFTQPDNFVLVGNPYQSVVDLKEVDYAGVFDDEFYVWDPRLGDNDNGAYVTVTTGTGISDPSGSDANEFLQPGQAVFMLTESTGPHSITFNESDKATSIPQTEVFSTTNIPYLNMRLYTTARFNAGGKEHDAMGLRFHDENTIHQFRNARKLGNSAETMAFLVGDDFASIQHAVLEADENQFPIYLGSYQHQEYTFWFQLENLPEGVTAYLKDDYTEELTELQQGVNSIAFTVDAAIQGSISTNRFSIAFDIESLSNEDFEESAFEFYPNPTDAILSINLGSYQATNTKVKIYDVTGRLLMQTNFTTNESIIQIDMSQLNTGLYFVEVAEGDKKFTSKVLKR